MFGRVDLIENGKKKKKMRRVNFLENVWLGGGERKMMLGLRCFLPRPIKKFSYQNEEKTKWGEFDRQMTKMHVLAQGLVQYVIAFGL